MIASINGPIRPGKNGPIRPGKRPDTARIGLRIKEGKHDATGFNSVGGLFAGPAVAQGWTEPARGTPTRSALMDALRPHALWLLGSPVEFHVHDLRVSGNLAFASVYPQRPGGAEIALLSTPGYERGEIDPQDLDGVGMQALYYKSGDTWVAVHWAMGPTDVWYAYEPICNVWRKVIPEACEGL